MTDIPLDQLFEGDWVAAALRLVFIGLIYLFLFLVLKMTARELNSVALTMAHGDGHTMRMALEIEHGAESSLALGESLLLHPRTVIGRGAGCEIVVDDPHVSARHAEIRFERGRWWLRDLGSSNGTSINGEPVRAVVGVRPGDVLQCGRVRFRFVSTFSAPSGIDSV